MSDRLFIRFLDAYDFDEEKAFAAIDKIKNSTTQADLRKSAKVHYAIVHECDAEDVYIGDIDFAKRPKNFYIDFPYTVVIGNLKNLGSVNYVNMSKLKAVHGSIDASFSKVNSWPNLYFVRDKAAFAGVKGLNLPSFKICHGTLIADGATITDLPLKNGYIVHLNGTDIEKFCIKSCYMLDVSGCDKLKDIQTLESVYYLSANNTNIEFVNDNLLIKDSLVCDNSNNLRGKIKPNNISTNAWAK